MSRELQVAIAAARAGAAELAAARRGDLRVDYKDARANLVTVADHRSQQAISDVILEAFPRGHAIDGEEGAAGDPDAQHVWYVDPLDGTTNYAHGLPFFCVSIALRSGIGLCGLDIEAHADKFRAIADGLLEQAVVVRRRRRRLRLLNQLKCSVVSFAERRR